MPFNQFESTSGSKDNTSQCPWGSDCFPMGPPGILDAYNKENFFHPDWYGVLIQDRCDYTECMIEQSEQLVYFLIMDSFQPELV